MSDLNGTARKQSFAANAFICSITFMLESVAKVVPKPVLWSREEIFALGCARAPSDRS